MLKFNTIDEFSNWLRVQAKESKQRESIGKVASIRFFESGSASAYLYLANLIDSKSLAIGGMVSTKEETTT